jgi:hypothetical protein
VSTVDLGYFVGSPKTDVPKSTPGHGGAREGAGRPPGIRGARPKTEQNDAYTILAKAKAKRETYRAHLEELKYREAAKELIQARDFEIELASGFKAVATTLETLPDILERDCELTGAQVERVQAVIDRLRDDLYSRLTR